MSIDWKMLTISLFIILIGVIVYYCIDISNHKKRIKKFEESERELKIEEERRVNAAKEIADEIARKRAAVQYWLGQIERYYPWRACPPDVHIRSLIDAEQFCKVVRLASWGCFEPGAISHYEHMGNQYKLFIPFGSTDGWTYALTIQKVCHMYIVDIIPLGNDQTNFNMPEEPSWNYPHIEIPDYMMDRAHWHIKENFEYFKPYGFTIAQEVEEDEESPSLSFNEMMTKMADGINAFAKTLKGEDDNGTE